MFTLSINNRQLVLDSDFSVSLTYKNPCWCFDEIPAPVCLDVTIPDNDTNRNILSFPGRFAKAAKSNDRKFAGAELRWRGFLFIYGTLVITETNSDGGYDGYIQSELKNLSDAQLEKDIAGHELGGELTFQNKTDYDPDTDLYCTIKLANPGFWTDKGATETYKNDDGEDEETEVLTHKFEKSVGSFVNYTSAEGIKIISSNTEAICVSPFVFLHRLISLILKENSFFFRNNFLASDSILKTLCLYTNRSICNPETVLEDLLNRIIWYKYHTKALSLSALTKIKLLSWSTGTFYLSKLLPEMQLNELLLSVQNFTNSFYFFTGINTVDNIDRESLFDMEPFDLSKYRVSKWRPGERQNLILKFSFDHDSDDQEFSENYTDLSDREDDILDPVETYAELEAIENPVIGNIRLVKSEKMYYEYCSESVEDEDTGEDVDTLMWSPISMDIQPYSYNKENGDDTEDIETKFSTLRMHEDGYPIAYQKGNNSLFSQYNENFTPRLLFYNGNNTGGSEATSGLEINWKSIVPERWRRTAPFYANALPVEAGFRFPGNIFYKVLNEIYRPFLDKEGSFFIKEIQDATGTGNYIEATLTVFKNEDNVFESTESTVDGDGSHASSSFVPKFLGISDTGQPVLVNAAGLYKAMSVFGELSEALYAEYCCIDYSSDDKLLFVGGKNGMLHVCDLSDLDNIRYKSIQIFYGTYDVSCVSLVDTGTTKYILAGKADGCSGYVQPYHASFDDYVSGETSLLGDFSSGSGHLRGFLYSDSYFYAVSRNGEIFRTSDLTGDWSELEDRDRDFVQIRQTQDYLFAAELNDAGLFCQKSNPTNWDKWGLEGSTRQKVRDICPMDANRMLVLCEDENEGIWLVDKDNDINENITPGVLKAKGACWNGSDAAYISTEDSSGYTRIQKYMPGQLPFYQWSYISVPMLFSKLFLW